MSGSLGIAVVDHRRLVRYGLEQVVGVEPGLRLAASVESPDDLAAALAAGDGRAGDRTAGALGLVLAGLPTRLDHAGYIRKLARHGPVLLLVSADAGRNAMDLLRAGAHGCVCDQVDEYDLMLAIRAVAGGGCHVGRDLFDRMRDDWPEQPAPPETRPLRGMLAPREVETLRWLAEGLTHREIGRRMGLTEATISTYVKRVRAKLNLRNKADLTRAAVEAGLLEPEGDPARVP